nr:hypothetical protein [Salmonella enterica]
MSSHRRSFGERVTTYEALRQAICQHAARAAEKLHGERQFCRHISVQLIHIYTDISIT